MTYVVCVDTVPERSALMESVYPRLYLHCKQRGYDFRMIDLRSGVGDPVSDSHDLAEMHMETLRRCQETEGPTFIVGLIAHSSFTFQETLRGRFSIFINIYAIYFFPFL